MLKYKEKLYSTYYGKWKTMKYGQGRCKGHIDFNKYSYKIGHKIYVGPNQEVRDEFKKEKEQHKLWMQLTE